VKFYRAASLDDLWSGEMRAVCVAGRRVLLVNLGGEVRAYEDRCRHRGFPLSDGRLTGCIVTCPVHGWQYDLTSGQGVNPESVKLLGYVVKIEGDDILVSVDRRGDGAQ
jgi:toluene monooxygenase system ferredoxin subunit